MQAAARFCLLFGSLFWAAVAALFHHPSWAAFWGGLALGSLVGSIRLRVRARR